MKNLLSSAKLNFFDQSFAEDIGILQLQEQMTSASKKNSKQKPYLVPIISSDWSGENDVLPMPVVTGALGNKAILLACMPSFRFFQQYIAAKAKAIKTKTTPTKTPTKAEALPESKNTKVLGIHLVLCY